MAPTCRDFCLLALPFALLHVLLRPSPASSPLMPGAACAHESRWFEDVLFSLWALASGSGDNHAQNTLLYALIDALDATGMSMNNYGFAPAPRELGVERYQLQMYAEVSGALGGWLERTARLRLIAKSCILSFGRDALFEANKSRPQHVDEAEVVPPLTFTEHQIPEQARAGMDLPSRWSSTRRPAGSMILRLIIPHLASSWIC